MQRVNELNVIAAAFDLIAVLDGYQATAPVIEHPAIIRLRAALGKLEKEACLEDPLSLQNESLARFIAENVPGEPSESGGAIETAIRLLRAVYTPGSTVR